MTAERESVSRRLPSNPFPEAPCGSRPDWTDARAYRPDPVELLREVGGEDRPLVSLPAKLLVAAVWVACTLYCIAIWTGFAQ